MGNDTGAPSKFEEESARGKGYWSNSWLTVVCSADSVGLYQEFFSNCGGVVSRRRFLRIASLPRPRKRPFKGGGGGRRGGGSRRPVGIASASTSVGSRAAGGEGGLARQEKKRAGRMRRGIDSTGQWDQVHLGRVAEKLGHQEVLCEGRRGSFADMSGKDFRQRAEKSDGHYRLLGGKKSFGGGC